MIITEVKTLYTVCTCTDVNELQKIADGETFDCIEYYDDFYTLDMAKGFAMGLFSSNDEIQYACVIKDKVCDYTYDKRKYLKSEVIFELIDDNVVGQCDTTPKTDSKSWS